MSDELTEAMQFAMMAIKMSEHPHAVLEDFGLNPRHVEAAGEGAGDEVAFATGLLTGMILERRRNDG